MRATLALLIFSSAFVACGDTAGDRPTSTDVADTATEDTTPDVPADTSTRDGAGDATDDAETVDAEPDAEDASVPDADLDSDALADVADAADAPADATDAADAADAADAEPAHDPHDHPTFPPPDLGEWDAPAPTLVASDTPPNELADLDATHFGGISCGPYAQNVFDLLLPGEGDAGPYPLLLFIHGGGFTGGSRTGSFGGGSGATRSYVDAGLAYATIDYRFLDDAGVRTSLQDSQVCLQYIRMHADALGIDPERIVLAGVSAGAGTSLWLGTSEDLADEESPHAVLRESTRVRGVVLDRGQAHYDILAWRDDVFSPEFAEIFDVGIELGLFDGQLREMYGIAAGEDALALLAEDPGYLEYRATLNFLDHVDDGDAEVWAQTNDGTQILIDDLGTVTHSPYHVRAVLRAARAAGLAAQANAPAIGETAAESRAAFALRVAGP